MEGFKVRHLFWFRFSLWIGPHLHHLPRQFHPKTENIFMLCILTNKRVLGTPFNVRKHIFHHFFITYTHEKALVEETWPTFFGKITPIFAYSLGLKAPLKMKIGIIRMTIANRFMMMTMTVHVILNIQWKWRCRQT